MSAMQEPAYLAEVAAAASGPNGWVARSVMATQVLCALAAVYCGWRFYAGAEVLPTLKWGLSAAVLMIVATQMKTSLMAQVQVERVLRVLAQKAVAEGR